MPKKFSIDITPEDTIPWHSEKLMKCIQHTVTVDTSTCFSLRSIKGTWLGGSTCVIARQTSWKSTKSMSPLNWITKSWQTCWKDRFSASNSLKNISTDFAFFSWFYQFFFGISTGFDGFQRRCFAAPPLFYHKPYRYRHWNSLTTQLPPASAKEATIMHEWVLKIMYIETIPRNHKHNIQYF